MDEKRERLLDLLSPVVAEISTSPWTDALAQRLNDSYPPGSELFEALKKTCGDGVAAGWMGLEGTEERKGARVVEPGARTNDMSIDVVQLIDFTGPHHRHPNGEVCAVMPEQANGSFDGNPEGWAVYSPGSEHWPAGAGGRVHVLFFLPEGAIEYTNREASLSSGKRGSP